jgi:hypothetical protein
MKRKLNILALILLIIYIYLNILGDLKLMYHYLLPVSLLLLIWGKFTKE